MMKTSIKFNGEKNDNTKRLIMSMLEILEFLGIIDETFTDRRLEKTAMAVLAAGEIRSSFKEAKTGVFRKSRDIITFENQYFSENISYGSYDDIRRKDLLLPVESGIVIRSSSVESQAVNNPTRGYALSPGFAELLKNIANTVSSAKRKALLRSFKSDLQEFQLKLKQKRDLERIPVTLPNDEILSLSAGEHNVLQKLIIEEFLPRFGMGAQLLYVGDTENKYLYKNEEELTRIGFFNLEHEELPDVVAYSPEKQLLFLIEAVHSTGPMSETRVLKLKRQLSKCKIPTVFVTAFLDKTTFKKYVMDIAWESEVWIANTPEHMIHFNGFKFLEIHK